MARLHRNGPEQVLHVQKQNNLKTDTHYLSWVGFMGPPCIKIRNKLSYHPEDATKKRHVVTPSKPHVNNLED